MLFDPDDHIVKLCAHGMELEGQGKPHQALAAFLQAWNNADTALQKLAAAHYLARHQTTTASKLEWDKVALEHALTIDDPAIKATYPSLYLNIAKCYEDLGDTNNALIHYQLAHSFARHLPDDGYGNMIKAGVNNGILRLSR